MGAIHPAEILETIAARGDLEETRAPVNSGLVIRGIIDVLLYEVDAGFDEGLF